MCPYTYAYACVNAHTYTCMEYRLFFYVLSHSHPRVLSLSLSLSHPSLPPGLSLPPVLPLCLFPPRSLSRACSRPLSHIHSLIEDTYLGTTLFMGSAECGATATATATTQHTLARSLSLASKQGFWHGLVMGPAGCGARGGARATATTQQLNTPTHSLLVSH